MEENVPIYLEPKFEYVIIKINEDYIKERGSIYEATRRAWKAKLENAMQYKYVLSVNKGVVLEVFEVEQWQECAAEPGRIEFVGHVASGSMANQVKGKMIPEYYRTKGLASPFLYKRELSIYEEPDFDYVIIKINEDYIEERGSVYEATRRAWRAKLGNAQKYKYVLAVNAGIVLEVFEVEQWQECAAEPGRIEFVGHVAPDSIASLVKGKIIPECYRVKGLASPFLYKKTQDGAINDEMPEEGLKETMIAKEEIKDDVAELDDDLDDDLDDKLDDDLDDDDDDMSFLGLKKAFREVGAEIKKDFGEVGRDVKKEFSEAGREMRSDFGSIGSDLKKQFGDVGKDFKKNFSKTGNQLKSNMQNVVKGTKTTPSGCGKFVVLGLVFIISIILLYIIL